MHIAFMGDIHGCFREADYIYEEYIHRFPEPDLLIQVGDYGYYPSNRDSYPHYWSRKFNHPVKFIDGNHENHAALFANPKAGQWEYMPRGSVDENNILYLGGAMSVDKAYRQRTGMHWSSLEELTFKDIEPVLQRDDLEDIEIVVSHTCPSSFNMKPYCSPYYADGSENKREKSRVNLQKVLDVLPNVRHWFFGHWHSSAEGELPNGGKWHMLDIMQIKSITI